MKGAPWMLIVVAALSSCRGRAPDVVVDAGVLVAVDAGVEVDAGPPMFDVSASASARPGTCVEGRWLLHDRGRLEDEPPTLVDCGAFDASCEPDFRGCVGRAGGPCDPRGVCRVDGHVDACADFLCPGAPRDDNGFDVPQAITLPTTLLVALEHEGDRDCFTFDSDAEGLIAFVGLRRLPAPVVVDAAPRPTLHWGGGVLTSVPAGVVKVCFAGGVGGAVAVERLEVRRVSLEDLPTLEDTGLASPRGHLCLGDTRIATAPEGLRVSRCGFGCAVSTGECIQTLSCATHADCPGRCERTIDGTGVCGPPIDPRVVDTCVEGRFIGANAVVTCAGDCVHGIGCVDSPGDVCAPSAGECPNDFGLLEPCVGPGFCADPLGGLVPCVDGRCPALTDDDAPGYFTPARPVTSTAPVTLRSDGPGDVDCVHVVEDEAPTWTPNLVGSGRLEQHQQLRIDGDVVRWDTKLCVSGHDGDVTLTFDP
jgi:hypothetical protein